RAGLRASHRYVDAARVAVQFGRDVLVADRVVVAGLAERGQRDADRVLRAVRAAGELGSPFRHGLVTPGPGSTPSRGSSGSDTADDRSSTSMMCSQASASSYPPPEAVPLTPAR